MPERAPDKLSLIEDFVNTRDLEEGVERLGSPPALAAWLADHGLAAPGETFDDGDLARTRTVREALRALLLTNNGGEPDPGAAAVLTAAGDAARLRASPPGTRTSRPRVAPPPARPPARRARAGARGRAWRTPPSRRSARRTPRRARRPRRPPRPARRAARPAHR